MDRDHPHRHHADHGHGDAADHHGGGHGHDGHEGHSVAMFRDRFWWSLAMTVVVIAYSEMVQDWLGFSPPAFPGDHLVAPVLGTVVFVYGGRPFLSGGIDELHRGAPGMMLLISLAIVVSFTASWATTLGWLDLEFWWELAALVTVMLLGHWLEMRAIGQAQGALAALAELLPDEAERVGDDTTETVAVADLVVGDVVLVRPGGRVPADGVIVDGEADIDESTVTGESRPVTKAPGDRVVAGTVSTDSAVRVAVDAVGEDTALAGIRRLVSQAQRSRSRAQVLADRAAALLFYVALGAALVTAVVWAAVGDVDAAISRTVTVLVIACPHALGLAIPLVVSISTSMAARHGVLITDRLALEAMRTVDAVLFDKTGTLTRGEHRVSAVTAPDGDEAGLLAVAAAAEADSEHPLARAIVAAAGGAAVPAATGFRARAGRGVEARVEGSLVSVGGPRLLAEGRHTVPGAVDAAVGPWRDRGASVLYVVVDGEVTGAVALEDQVRPTSAEAVRELQSRGIEVGLITGDAAEVGEAVAAELGIDRVMSEVVPEDKHEQVAALQRDGRRVAMVGDGVNDAPALAQADVGIAIGAGTDVAVASAGIVLAGNDPRAVPWVRRLSEAGYRKMLQNLWWAAGYNIVAIPLAAGALGWAGVVLSPAAGAVLMSISTVVVAINAQLLRRAL